MPAQREYSILTIQRAWEQTPESMGGKGKFWYCYPEEPEQTWLFKTPRPGTGQHWAEKVVEEMARLVQINCAPVELARLEGQEGSVTKSFTQGQQALWHGQQVLALMIQGYGSEKNFRQSSHTLSNIWLALERAFTTEEDRQAAKTLLAEYIVLDGLVGNTDRHHENWGFILDIDISLLPICVAPSFDHGSSLGRELKDERRERFLRENRVGNYAEKGRGAIYWSESDKRGPSPLELARRATAKYPDLFRPALNKLRRLDENAIHNAVNRVPAGWMSATAKQFATALTLYNFNELQRLLQ